MFMTKADIDELFFGLAIKDLNTLITGLRVLCDKGKPVGNEVIATVLGVAMESGDVERALEVYHVAKPYLAQLERKHEERFSLMPLQGDDVVWSEQAAHWRWAGDWSISSSHGQFSKYASLNQGYGVRTHFSSPWKRRTTPRSDVELWRAIHFTTTRRNDMAVSTFWYNATDPAQRALLLELRQRLNPELAAQYRRWARVSSGFSYLLASARSGGWTPEAHIKGDCGATASLYSPWVGTDMLGVQVSVPLYEALRRGSTPATVSQQCLFFRNLYHYVWSLSGLLLADDKSEPSVKYSARAALLIYPGFEPVVDELSVWSMNVNLRGLSIGEAQRRWLELLDDSFLNHHALTLFPQLINDERKMIGLIP